MKTIRSSLTLILLIYSIPTILSGLDIYSCSEPDLSSEWIIVSIYLILSICYCVINLVDLFKRTKPIDASN
jgi:hypothetical protein